MQKRSFRHSITYKLAYLLLVLISVLSWHVVSVAETLLPKSRIVLMDSFVERNTTTMHYRVCKPNVRPQSCQELTYSTPDDESRARLVSAIFLLQTATNARESVEVDFSSVESLEKSVAQFRETKLSPMDRALAERVEKFVVSIVKKPGCHEAAVDLARTLSLVPGDASEIEPPADPNGSARTTH